MTNLRKGSIVVVTGTSPLVSGVISKMAGENVHLDVDGKDKLVAKNAVTKVTKKELAELQGSAKKVTTKKTATKKETVKKEPKITKKSQCRDIYNEFEDLDKKERRPTTLAAFKERVGISQSCAATYFANFQSGVWDPKWVEKQAAKKAKKEAEATK